MIEEKSMKLSIIVPIYNTELYLTACLNSLTAQTCPDMEILLIDDGSTDGSAQICQEFAGKDKRITYIRQEIKD